jgi:hypothetical protein
MEEYASDVYDSFAEAKEEIDVEEEDEVSGKDEAFLKGYEESEEDEESKPKQEETEGDFEF